MPADLLTIDHRRGFVEKALSWQSFLFSFHEETSSQYARFVKRFPFHSIPTILTLISVLPSISLSPSLRGNSPLTGTPFTMVPLVD